MKNFAVYMDGGRIVRCGTCSDDQLACQALPGEYVIECDSPNIDMQSYHVQSGAVVGYQPSPPADTTDFTWEWNGAARRWAPTPTLRKLKSNRWDSIKIDRDAAEFGGFTWAGSTFDSDVQSQSRIQGASQLATLAMLSSQTFNIDWTLADNSVQTLSGADMLAVGQAMGVHVMTVHGTGRYLRNLIEAATTIEQLEGIAWPA
jgi:hypothetical protein